MKTNSLLLLSTMLLAACAPFRVGDIRVGNTPARKIAKDMSIPGKGVDGQCLPFAVALHHRFQAAGIPSKVIVFNYDSLGTTPGAFSGAGNFGVSKPVGGAHAMVAYNDEGRTYLMDNQSWMPTWVHGDSVAGFAQQFSGMDMKVADARTYAAATPRVPRATAPAAPTRKPMEPATPKAPEATAIPAYLTSLH